MSSTAALSHSSSSEATGHSLSQEAHIETGPAHDAHVPEYGEIRHEDMNDNDADSIVSESVTVEYDDEPFSTFQVKARALATDYFDIKSNNITAERIKGGAFNRIVGLTVSESEPRKWSLPWLRAKFHKSLCYSSRTKKDTRQRFVLRVPRNENEGYGMDYDVAVLKLIQRSTSLPIPELLSYDKSHANAIESSYMLQKHLPGHNLADITVFKSLNLAQMKDLARHMLVYQQTMLDITSSSPGVVSATRPIDETGKTQVETFPVPPPMKAKASSTLPLFTPSAPQSTYQFMVAQCERWIKYDKDSSGFVMEHWPKFRAIVDSLHDRGFFPAEHDRFYLHHSDLHPRNILITTPTSDTCQITGLLDWDAEFVHFAPFFAAYRPPFWLWISDEGDLDEDDSKEQDIFLPSVSEMDQEVKKVWEEIASDEWKRIAYTKEYVIARRMWEVLRAGIWATWKYDEVESLIADWLEMYPEDEEKMEEALRVADGFDDSEASDCEDSDGDENDV